MKVACVSRSARDLPRELIQPELGIGPDRLFSLVVGKPYVVYGITWDLGNLWYYICDEDYSYYPVWNPSALFQIVDNRLSSYWRIAIYTVGQAKLKMPVIAFEEWANDPLFYDRLTEGQRAPLLFSRDTKR